jgi:adenylate cyclase
MPADAGVGAALSGMDPRGGVEREIAVLFADLRAFTRFSEGRLPYDTVFVLNRYFEAMGEAIERAGGRVDKFVGDGIMALFGSRPGPRRRRARAWRRRGGWRWRSRS